MTFGGPLWVRSLAAGSKGTVSLFPALFRADLGTNQNKQRDNNKKFRSFKSKENIYKKDVGPYHGFGY